jgi:hypothetical protein
MSAQVRDILPLDSEEPSPQLRVGHLVACLGAGRVVVDLGLASGPLIARCLGTMSDDQLARHAARGAPVKVVFESGDQSRPLVIELMDGGPAARMSVCAGELCKRLSIEAADELVLRCGKASITLRPDGTILIKGTNVETRASRTNRIKGGQVRIN